MAERNWLIVTVGQAMGTHGAVKATKAFRYWITKREVFPTLKAVKGHVGDANIAWEYLGTESKTALQKILT